MPTMAEPVYASLDLGGTNLKGLVATAEGKMLAEGSEPTRSHEGPERVLERMADLLISLGEEAAVDLAAVGVGCPGLIDQGSGTTRFLPNLATHWRDVPVAERLGTALGTPVYLLNDVRMATLGELTFGHGRTASSIVFLALGTGIGGGVAIDGKLRLGPLGMAGELGHMILLPDGPGCGCGSWGCLETLASGPAITAEGVRLLLSGQAPELYRLTSGDAGRITPELMAQAARSGDGSVRDALVRAASFLGLAVANLVVTLHPEVIVLGGGVAGIGDLLFDTVRATLTERVRMFPTADVRLEPSQLGDRAGILGGIALARMGGIGSQR